MLVPVLDADPVRHVHVAQPLAEPGGHVQGVRTADGGVRQVEGAVREVLVDRAPARGVHPDLAAPGLHGEHVLDREEDIGLLLHAGEPGLELPGVLPLPAERRMHHHHGRAELLGDLLGAHQLAPRLASPDPLGDQQTGRVDGGDRHLVVVGEPPQHGQIL